MYEHNICDTGMSMTPAADPCLSQWVHLISSSLMVHTKNALSASTRMDVSLFNRLSSQETFWLVIVRKAQVLPFTTARCYSSTPWQCDSEAGSTKLIWTLINFLIYTCAFPVCDMSECALWKKAFSETTGGKWHMEKEEFTLWFRKKHWH